MPSKPDPKSDSTSLSPPTGIRGEFQILAKMVWGTHAAPLPNPQSIRETWLLLTLLAAMLTGVHYAARLNGPLMLEGLARTVGCPAWADSVRALTGEDWRLLNLLWWATVTITGYLGLPLVWVWVGGLPLRESMGWRVGKTKNHLSIYVGFALIMVLVLGWTTRQSEFLSRYPFYRIPDGVSLWPRFFLWEAFYLVQFIALESLFRGFLLYRLAGTLGSLAVPMAMVPYCMIHWGKPTPEAFASILAGLGLGLMSLRTGSIWPGAVLHMAVALTMDLASLYHQGRLL